MSNEQMTPEISLNNGSFLLAGSQFENPLIPDLLSKMDSVQDSQFRVQDYYQCIVCSFSRLSPTELHQHQISVHSAEQLSQSIIGLQVLYNKNRAWDTGTLNKTNVNTDLYKNPVNHSSSNKNVQSTSNVTVGNPLNSTVQEQSTCLKLNNQNCIINAGAGNIHRTQQPIISQKTAPCIVLNTSAQLNQKKEKEIYILPAVSKDQKTNFILNKGTKCVQKAIEIPKTVNVSNQSCILNSRNLHSNPTSLNTNENTHQNQFVSTTVLPNNPLLNSNVVQYLTEPPKTIVQKIEELTKSRKFLRNPKGKFPKSKTPVEKKKNLKTPEVVTNNLKVVKEKEIILKPEILEQKFEVIVHKSENVKKQVKIKEPKVVTKPEVITKPEINTKMEVITKPEALIKPAAVIKPDAIIKPETFIKPDAIIKPEAFIKPDAIIKPEVFIKPGVIINPEKNVKPEIKKDPETITKSDVILKIPESNTNKPEEIIKKTETILKNPVLIIKKLEKIEELKGQMNKSIAEGQKLKTKDGNVSNQLNLVNNSKPVSQKRKRPKPSASKPKAPSKMQKSLSQLPESSQMNSKPLRKKSKLLPNKNSQDVKTPSFFEDDFVNSWNNSKLQLEKELPTDITQFAMQDFKNISSIPEDSSYQYLTNEIFTQMDSYLTPQSLDEFNVNSHEMGINIIDYQANSNSLTGFNYSNDVDLTLEMNQPAISLVDSRESMWMNPEDNLIYADLQPVFQ